MKSAADALLPIVQSQRERFRSRAQELEAVCCNLYIFLQLFNVTSVHVFIINYKYVLMDLLVYVNQSPLVKYLTLEVTSGNFSGAQNLELFTCI